MTRIEFSRLCAELTIAPEVALDNEDVRAALAARDDDEVARILRDLRT